MNPSYADALKLDDTTMICTNLAILWGWRGFGIVNLNPSTGSPPISHSNIPKAIKDKNDDWIERSRSLADIFVLAAGNDDQDIMRDKITNIPILGPFHSIDKKNDGGGYPHPSIFKDKENYPQAPAMIEGNP
jgi:hypothetical protein